MATSVMTGEGGPSTADSAERSSLARRALLACGILAPVVYAAADVLGGMRYDGYSFASQAVSELMAIGAPSERFVDPLFIAFGVLLLCFGVGVFREGGGQRRALRITGALLTAYAAIGFTGPTLFEMHPRGTAGADGDLPHIVVTGAIVLLTLLSLGFGAFTLGSRFRRYSLVTLLTVTALGLVSVPYGARLAAGQSTPGFGIVERVVIYASLLWVAILAAALLRRPLLRGAATTRVTATHFEGFVDTEDHRRRQGR
jgi:hypothetical membrane protein